MTFIWHNRRDGGKSFPLQACRILPMSHEGLLSWRGCMRGKVSKKVRISLDGIEVPIEHINTKDKLCYKIYDVYGTGVFDIMGFYVNNFSRRRFKRAVPKRLATIVIRQSEDSDEPIFFVTNMQRLKRLKWFND